MSPFRKIHLAACAVLTTVSVDAQDPGIEAFRPVSIYAEDFESFPDGEDGLMGGVPLANASQWVRDPGVGVIASEIRGDALPSQQIVVSGGKFTWQSDWITIEPGYLATVSLDLTARSGAEGFLGEDNVLVYVQQTNEQPSQVFDLKSDTGFLEPGTRPVPVYVELGPFREPTEVQITLHASAASEDTVFALDNVQVDRENVVAQIPRVPEYLFIRAQLSPPEPLESMEQRYLEFAVTYASEVALDLDSVDGDELSLFARAPTSSRPRLEFMGAEVSDGAGVVFHPSLDSRLSAGFIDRRRDIDIDVDIQLDADVHFVSARYRVARPEGGWETFGKGEFSSSAPQLKYHPYSIEAHDGRLIAVVFMSNEPPLAAIPRSRNNQITFPAGLQVRPSDSHLDFVAQFQAETAIDISSLGNNDIFAQTHNFSWTQMAELLEIQEVSQDRRHVSALYRLERPAFGWPRKFAASSGSSHGEGTFSLRNSVLTTPAFFEAYATVEVLDEHLDHIAIALPNEDQLISRLGDTYRLQLVYTCETPLDLASFGNGDVHLVHDDQPGTLVLLESSDGDRQVVATFEFARERHSFPTLHLTFPLGSVQNVAGTTYLGKSSQFDPGSPVVRWDDENWHTISADFQPQMRFSRAFAAYRFRVSYHSTRAPIDLKDIAQSHITATPSGLVVRTTAFVTRNDGKDVDVDYVLEPSEGTWPDRFTLKLLTEAVRDLDGSSHEDHDLATIGFLNEEAFDGHLIGGFLIEGDPATHHLSFLVDPHKWSRRAFSGATLLFGGTSQLLPTFDDAGEAPLLEGRYVGLRDFDSYSVITYALDRPEAGWAAWGASRLLFSLQLLDADVLHSGDVVIDDLHEALPLLFSFEEWVRRLEEQADLPTGSLHGDADGDGVDGLTEYALGGDLQEKGDSALIKPRLVTKDGDRHIELTFHLRTNAFGLKAEIQSSSDGKQWRSADESFEAVERREIKPDIDLLRLCSKEAIPEGELLQLFRIVIVD